MNHEMKKKNKEILAIVLLVLAYIVLQVVVIRCSMMNQASFNGVFSAIQYGLCLLMLGVNRKTGIRTSIVLISISILLIIRTIIFDGTIQAWPGLFNSIFYMITLILLAFYYRKQEKESITDLLTGILNRRGIYRYLQEKIEDNKALKIVYISLDNYKFLNDSYGHAFGDELLRLLTRRMTDKIGKDGVLARIGGVEFVAVLFANEDNNELVNELLDVIREKCSLAVNGNEIECYVTCYAGISSCPQDSKHYESLIKYADIAMYEAMSSKSKTAFSFDENMARYMNRQIEIEKLIKEGLDDDYFYLVYQPQHDIHTRKLRGFETLIRMKNPVGQPVSPGEFIPVAEKGEMIFQIDEYVLNRALTEFKDIVEENKDLTISVNVSAKNIANNDFVNKLERILDATGYPAQNLEIEITEYCLLNSMDVTIDNITQLRKRGVKVALDDFGTGYTSLSYVSKLPINKLKVDKSLVDDIVNDEKRRMFVQIVISMGHLMGCEVISEGVEDYTQLEFLRNDGCDMVQGYVWGRPMAYEEARQLSLAALAKEKV